MVSKRMRERNKEKSRWGAYAIVSIIALLMITSLATVILYAPPAQGDIVYGEHTFTVENNVYVSEGRIFHSLPQGALSIPMDAEATNLLKTAPQIVMTYDPKDVDLVSIDTVRFAIATALPSVGAALSAPSDAIALPIVDCFEANPSQVVLHIRTAARPAIFHEGYCVVMQGNGTSLLLAKDAFLYHYYDMLLFEDLTSLRSPMEEKAAFLSEEIKQAPVLNDKQIFDFVDTPEDMPVHSGGMMG